MFFIEFLNHMFVFERLNMSFVSKNYNLMSTNEINNSLKVIIKLDKIVNDCLALKKRFFLIKYKIITIDLLPHFI